MRALLLVCVLAVVAGGLAACGDGTEPSVVSGGDPARGHDRIVFYGCGSCHRIPGVEGANGTVGPTLHDFDGKQTIAGELPSSPEAVAGFIQDPQAIRPQGIMPDLGVTEPDARDITAYLLTR